MRITNQRDGCTLADNVELAQSLIARVVGLIGRHSLPEHYALIIPGCRQVHTFLMRFPIDLLFCSAQNRVISIYEHFSPSRVSGYFRDAAYVIELPAGAVSACGVREDDVLEIEDSSGLTN